MKKYTVMGNLLKKLRAELGISQMDFAKSAGFTTQQQLCNMERGIAHLPKKAGRLLSKKYKIPYEMFIEAWLTDHEMDYWGEEK